MADPANSTLAFIEGLGGPEMVMIFVVVLLLFGGHKLPEFARGLGKTMREFKKAASGVEEEFKRALEEDERKKFAP
ncbi:MAG: twin-arginine translocase TatA/TatE family subunit, partial [Opitutus sp.]